MVEMKALLLEAEHHHDVRAFDGFVDPPAQAGE
jgi:hypothetical protein